MGNIYSFSDRVFVWLGPAVDGETEHLPSLVESLSSLWNDRDESDTSIVTEDDFERYDIPLVTEGIWQSFLALLRRPWTRRVWVIQEVALSSKTVVLCGNTLFDWEKLAVAAKVIDEYRMFDSSQLVGTDGIPAIDDIRVQARDEELLGLDFTLSITREYQATDPRDRVYALLGLVETEDSEAIQPDYTISTADLYMKVAWYFINKYETLDILAQVGFGAGLKGLPSWVPDWSVSVPHHHTSLTNVSHGAYWADVSKHNAVISGIRNQKLLELSGKIINSVKTVGEMLKVDESVSGTRESRCRKVFNEWEEMAMAIENYTDEYGDISVNAYWKTLIAGSTTENEEVDDEYGLYFLEWHTKYRPRMSFINTKQINTKKSDLSKDEGVAIFSDCLFEACLGRRYGITAPAANMGLFPGETRSGDLVVLFFGARFPFIVRSDGDAYRLVGMCYVHGIWLDVILDSPTITTQTFTLV